MTTLLTFVDQLSALNITGVKRKYDHMPNTVNTADLPAMFPQDPGLTYESGGEWASTCTDTSTIHTGTLIVLVEAAGQDTSRSAFRACVRMQDSIYTAVTTWTDPVDATPETRQISVNVGGVDYWAVRAVVTARYLG